MPLEKLTMAKRSPEPAPLFDEFRFWVRRPSITCSFSLQFDRREDDPYAELLSLQFPIECLEPKKFRGRETVARFFGREGLEAGSPERQRRPEQALKAVGSLHATRTRFDVGGFLPPSMCWNLCTAMTAGSVTSLSASAFWTKRGHAYLKSLAFRGPEFDPLADLD
ncbi:MAG: hypothetical protein ACK58O_10120 [Brevundimonas sp.]|jgi:hypothetical protein|uniref:hypothetical protein n=1 Tax=Brevundimonas sp. TaxID=1871086 RepID=UPI00391F3794